MPNSFSNNPICKFCRKEIEVANPLEMRDGFYHRVCWIKEIQK